MNKAMMAGIIVAAAVIIGVVSALSYSNNFVDNRNKQTEIVKEPLKVNEPSKTVGKKFQVNLTETVGAGANP